MIRIRRAEDRGRTQLAWLDGRHTFSFGEYHDPEHMAFGVLRVINDDRIAPGGGFGTHPHRDMEIVTIMLDGALRHADDMGNGSVIRPGDVQRMTAGRGVRHSEHNDSADEPAHLLQIWLLPEARGLPPSYEQRDIEPVLNAWTLVASRDGRDGSVTIHQDVDLHRTRLAAEARIEVVNRSGRRTWLQMATGSARLGDRELHAGDGVAIEGDVATELVATTETDVLRFDLP